MKLTSKSFPRSVRCSRYEDIIFLPYPPTYKELDNLGKSLEKKEWLPRVLSLPKSSEQILQSGALLAMLIYPVYEEYRTSHNDKEPEWVSRMSRTGKRFLRQSYGICGEGLEHYACVPGFPYTGVGYVVLENGLVQAVDETFGLGRLRHIRQLGYLHDPIVREAGYPQAMGTTFDHTRYLHSLDVAAITTLILLRNGSPKNFISTMQAAALTHDTLTPAGGDTTKIVDPVAFNEETDYPKLLEGEKWNRLALQYELSGTQMTDAVQGRGLPGTVLDIADKISYVARDAYAYFCRFKLERMTPGCKELNGFLQKNSLVCGLWDSVRIDGERAIITDAKKLKTFLTLRGLLFRQLYQSPAARYFEHIISSVIVRHLYRAGKLTKAMLLKMTDENLDRWLDAVVTAPGWQWSTVVGGVEQPMVESFAFRTDAEAREQALLKEGFDITLIEHINRIMKPCTHFLVPKEGEVMPFHDAYPSDAEEIRVLFRVERPFRLYYARSPRTFGPLFWEAMRSSRLERLAVT